MPAPATIHELVQRFADNRDAYKSDAYNETQVRREFVDPFFTALGWDVENKAGYAEDYKDVVHEDKVKVGGATKAPDYSFRVGMARKFFVEAKKPSVDIRTGTAPAFQLRRYAWSAKLPVSILTDFEEFAVYDGRIVPKEGDGAGVARLLFVKYTDYVEKWDEIAALFSKEAVLKGAFDRFADDKKARRGTTEVDAAFLSEIETWRNALAADLAAKNRSLSTRQLNFAVQKTIDRIIFLRICEDRGIENLGRLQSLLNGKNVYDRLIVQFRDADERYNSGLFHFGTEKGRDDAELDTLSLTLKIGDDVLKAILKSLYYPAPYAFDVFPADILGQVYEQFLGKVIVLDAKHKATVELKPEVRKAGGVFYTPTYIVDYIVAQTVGKLIAGKTPKQVESLSVLDPACGSGSFLIGAYQTLLDWHLRWYEADGIEKHARGKDPKVYQAAGGAYRLTTNERKRILLNNIYGVDIDSQAVEVTKLSLLLKMLEGVTRTNLVVGRVLPDLGKNIHCGNSLIGPDFYDNQQLTMMDEEEVYRVNAFDWKGAFPKVLGGANPGFDAVIGNPPYGAYLYSDDRDYLLLKFKFQNYQLDSYLLFLEVATGTLMKQSALLGMIIPNPWLTNISQTKIRKYIFDGSDIQEIIHFHFPVFPKVTVDTQIIVIKKSVSQGWIVKSNFANSANDLLTNTFTSLMHKQDDWRQKEGLPVNIFVNDKEIDLAEKCLTLGEPLQTFAAINVGIKPYQVGKGVPKQTRDDVTNRSFDSDLQLDDSYRAYLRGKDINRYITAPVEQRYLKYGVWLAEPRPAAKFDAPYKIIMRQTGDSIIATLDTNKYLCLNNMHIIVPNTDGSNVKNNASYLLGLVNSRLINWYYQTLNPEVGEALAEVKKTNVARLPIRRINFSDPADSARHNRMVALVEQMLALTAKLAAADSTNRTMLSRQIETTDHQIDRLVYELYGLTDDEISLVESKA